MEAAGECALKRAESTLEKIVPFSILCFVLLMLAFHHGYQQGELDGYDYGRRSCRFESSP